MYQFAIFRKVLSDSVHKAPFHTHDATVHYQYTSHSTNRYTLYIESILDVGFTLSNRPKHYRTLDFATDNRKVSTLAKIYNFYRLRSRQNFFHHPRNTLEHWCEVTMNLNSVCIQWRYYIVLHFLYDKTSWVIVMIFGIIVLLRAGQ